MSFCVRSIRIFSKFSSDPYYEPLSWFMIKEEKFEDENVITKSANFMSLKDFCIYHIAGKFGKFGKSSAVRQTKLTVTINNLVNNPLALYSFAKLFPPNA